MPLGATGLPICLSSLTRLHQHQVWRDVRPPAAAPASSARPGACWGHMGRGLGQSRPRATGLPHPAPDGAHWPPRFDCPLRPLPAGLLPPPRPGPTFTSLLSRPPAGGSEEPAATWSCLFSARLKVTRGYWGCWLSRESESLDTWGPASPLPPNPVMGAYRPTSSRLRLLECLFFPLDPTLCPQSPSRAGGPRRLPS